MSEINKLRSILLDSSTPVEERKEAAANLAKLGGDEAIACLREGMVKETDPECLLAIFEALAALDNFEAVRAVSDALDQGKDFPPEPREKIASFLEGCLIHPHACLGRGSAIIAGGMIAKALKHLIDNDRLFSILNSCLKTEGRDIHGILSGIKDQTGVLKKLLDRLAFEPEHYRGTFVEMFTWFLDNPHPEICELLGKVWVLLPSGFKEAIRLYFAERMGRFYEYAAFRGYGIIISSLAKHPIMEWLEGFERGLITSAPSSYHALQRVSERAGLHLKDKVLQVETREPSPIRLKRHGRHRRDWEKGWEWERDRQREIELIPIDKFLGEYLPQDQQIKLYLEEIEVSARKLGVDQGVLRRVVEIHEAAHAVVHLGRDADGRCWSVSDFQMADSGRDPSPWHETLAQLLCWHCVKDDPALLECFEKLNERQPLEYRHWYRFKDIPLERIRTILVHTRQGKIKAGFEMLDELSY